MHSLVAASLLGLASASSVRRQSPPDNTQPTGKNPVSVGRTNFLGEQHSNNSCTHRDLGFTGLFAGDWYGLYGDTLYCAGGVTDPDQDTGGFNGMVRDALARLTDDPLTIEWAALNSDTPIAHPTQFVPYNEAWGETSSTGFGGTSLCQIDDHTAIVFYLINNNDAGLGGAGVAKVELQNGNPVVTKRMGDEGYWWDSTNTPRYGDVAAYVDVNSEYIYAWGGAPTTVTDTIGSQYVYQLRVRAADALDLTKYEYWWGRGQGWKVGQPLTEFTPETAVMWGVGQGSTYYSPYYETYMYVHFNGGDVAIRTAPAPEGPWTDDVSLYTPQPYPGGMVYAPGVHPYTDSTGETMTISYTNNNHIQVIKATFNSK
ncbi:hypothetical protein FE257_007273 [Aspergillus nanangensis]|uniref:DUF4185 domain-containing protein n=1 Tax=Aspergillus nanangensis TaxID=2582783 RepID=A0AAD4CPS3_ASPNN|nr:hypothetical protein FE257_007273 [Aspergillus nanangensis]